MSAPVPDLPAPGAPFISGTPSIGGVGVGVATGCIGGGTLGFTIPKLKIVLPCGISFGFPAFPFGLHIPSFSLAFFLKLPSLFLKFSLNCDLNNPVDISGGLVPPAAGGRVGSCDPDPDTLQEAA